MGEEEIAALVVRISGDASSYTKALREAQVETARTATQVEQSAKKIEDISKGLETFASSAVKALGALGVATSLNAAFDRFSAAEVTMLRLKAVVEANGQAVEQTVGDYKAFADQINNTTLTSRAMTLTMLTQAATMGLSNEQAKKAVEISIAAAAAKGGEAQGYMQAAIMMQQGNTQRMAMMLGLRGIHGESEKAAMVQKMLASGVALSGAMFESASGRIKVLGRALADVTLEIGGMVAKAIMPLVQGLTKLVEGFRSLDPFLRSVVIAVVTLGLAFVSIPGILALLGPGLRLLTSTLTVLSSTLALMPSLWTALGASFEFVLGLATSLGGVLLSLLNPLKLVSVAFGLLSTIAGGLFAGIGTLLSPVTLLLAGVAAGVAMLVEHFGGLEKTWEAVKVSGVAVWESLKAGVASFLNFVKPTTDALGSLFAATWEQIKAGARAVWVGLVSVFTSVRDFLAEVWSSTGLDAKKVWEGIRDAAVTAIRFIEMIVRNLGEILGAIWAGVKAAAVGIWEGVKNAAVLAWRTIRDSAVTAWGTVKDVIMRFVEWVAPIALSVAGGFVIGWMLIRTAAETAWTAVSAVLYGVTKFLKVMGDGVAYVASMFSGVGQFVLTTLGTMTGAILAGIAAWKLLTLAISLTSTVLAFFHVQQILSVAGWLIWNAAALVAIGIQMVFNISLTIAKVLVTAYSFATGVAATAQTLAAAATTAWNIALSLTIVIVSALAAAAVAAFVAISSAAIAAYKSAGAFLSIMADMATVTGPIGAISAMFKEWYGMIQDIIRAVRVDMDLAWKMVKVSGQIALEEIRLLWPPLWKFISGGFQDVAIFMGNYFEREFYRAAANITSKMAETAAVLDPTGATSERLQKASDKLNKEMNKLNADSLESLEKLIGARARMFTQEIGKESDYLKTLREEWGKLQSELKDKELKIKLDVPTKEELNTLVNNANKAGISIGDAASNAVAKHLHTDKLDAVLFGSAQHLKQVEDFRERMKLGKADKDQPDPVSAASAMSQMADKTKDMILAAENASRAVMDAVAKGASAEVIAALAEEAVKLRKIAGQSIADMDAVKDKAIKAMKDAALKDFKPEPLDVVKGLGDWLKLGPVASAVGSAVDAIKGMKPVEDKETPPLIDAVKTLTGALLSLLDKMFGAQGEPAVPVPAETNSFNGLGDLIKKLVPSLLPGTQPAAPTIPGMTEENAAILAKAEEELANATGVLEELEGTAFEQVAKEDVFAKALGAFNVARNVGAPEIKVKQLEEMAEQAMDPGSIYVHDTHSLPILKEIRNILSLKIASTLSPIAPAVGQSESSLLGGVQYRRGGSDTARFNPLNVIKPSVGEEVSSVLGGIRERRGGSDTARLNPVNVIQPAVGESYSTIVAGVQDRFRLTGAVGQPRTGSIDQSYLTELKEQLEFLREAAGNGKAVNSELRYISKLVERMSTSKDAQRIDELLGELRKWVEKSTENPRLQRDLSWVQMTLGKSFVGGINQTIPLAPSGTRTPESISAQLPQAIKVEVVRFPPLRAEFTNAGTPLPKFEAPLPFQLAVPKSEPTPANTPNPVPASGEGGGDVKAGAEPSRQEKLMAQAVELLRRIADKTGVTLSEANLFP